ncbi:MAG: hypothetical protein LUG15_02785 [Oscillospiraceae bacterium]|nr:hypothetical protein [Oscillospiraceae bacterium]
MQRINTEDAVKTAVSFANFRNPAIAAAPFAYVIRQRRANALLRLTAVFVRTCAAKSCNTQMNQRFLRTWLETPGDVPLSEYIP